MNQESFDTFLSYNRRDKEAVRNFARLLKSRGVKVWLDEEQIMPGDDWQKMLEEAISTVRTAAVLIGASGIGPWEETEMRACLFECLDRSLRVIPVLLKGAPNTVKLPSFLNRLQRVDLREEYAPAILDRLALAMTGGRSNTQGEALDPLPLLTPMPARQDAEACLYSPLGPEFFTVKAFSGTEEISRLFNFDLELQAEEFVPHEDMLGANVTLSIKDGVGGFRHFNGFVTGFSKTTVVGKSVGYRATIRPWLWFLTRTSDCRVFQQKAVTDIVEDVFRSLGYSDYQLSLVERYTIARYSVQYRETSFNFVTRLLEHYGIFFYWRHAPGKHVLVLGDSEGAYAQYPGHGLRFDPVGNGAECVSSWSRRIEKTSDSYSQVYTATPKVIYAEESKSKVGPKHFDIFDFPGEFQTPAEAKRLTRVRLEELEVSREVAEGTSKARKLMPGCTFKLTEHPDEREDMKFVVTAVTHSYTNSESGAQYINSFSAIPSKLKFRPQRITPVPAISGLQIATVVGPKGESTYRDNEGRIKVRFDWDRYSKHDENSSCWLRCVSICSTGENPMKIGDSVLVGFLEGNPDSPVMIGRM